RGDDPGLPLPRGDQVDVVGPLPLQLQKNAGQALHGDLLAKALGADGVVLAVAAFEGAPREKDGAAAPGAADAGLLPEVEGGPGRPAAAGAEGAAGRDGECCWHSA